MHIKTFKLSALRGINYFISRHAGMWGSDAGYSEMPAAELSRINVFCGRNGTGKSTILDVVRSLRRPELLLSLRRDIADRNALRAFELVFENSHAINVQFKGKEIDVRVLSRLNFREEIIGRAFPWVEPYGMTGEQQSDVQNAIATLRPMAFHWRGPEQIAIGDRFVNALQLLGSELIGLAQADGQPAIAYMDGVRVGLDYATDAGTWHTIPANLLPSGWRAAAGLIAWASRLPRNSIATIEEPENHLHPRLQRRVARELASVVRERNLQLLVSTHSPVFMNSSSWVTNGQRGEGIHIFQVDGRQFRAIPTQNGGRQSQTTVALLDDLGVLASDLLQASAVIWVEGPSDRIYIKFWLRRWCERYQKMNFVENVDYAFCFYGGAILSHFDADALNDAVDAISMLRVNKNSFVVMDRDDDFQQGGSGELIKTKKGERPKYKVIDALGDRTWVTDGYTIETYLPLKYVGEGLLEEADGCTKIGKVRTKVELARQYIRDSAALPYRDIFRTSLTEPSDSLAKLHQFIRAANQ